jgi:hypothetical protein
MPEARVSETSLLTRPFAPCHDPPMFGSHKPPDEDLRGRGKAAIAKIVDAQRTPWGVGFGPESVVSNTEIAWTLKLHVTPKGEEPFDVATEQRWPQLDAPRAGQKVSVLYDPDDHSKVAIDHHRPAEVEAATAMIESRLSPEQTRALQGLGFGSVGDVLSAAIADPQGFTAKMQERITAAQQAAMGQAEAMRAQAQAVQGGGSVPGPAAGAAEDLVDKLEKLADLRDRGALTEAEFEAQKQRLLEE